MGGNFSAAGTNLMAGVKGQTINAATGAATGVVSGGGNALLAGQNIANVPGMTGANLGFNAGGATNAATSTAAQLGQQGLQEAGKKGLIGTMMSSPYTAPALISTGGNMIAGYAQGAQQQEMLDQQREQEQERRDIYGQNVGAVLNMPVFNPQTGRYETPQNTTTLGG